MQSLTLEGRLGRDAVVRESSASQGQFIAFTVATNSKENGAEKTTWYDVMSSNPQHVKLAQYLKKGTPIIVIGELSAGVRQTPNGNSVVDLKIRHADRISFVSGGNAVSGTTVATEERAAETAAPAARREEVPADDAPMMTKPKPVQAADPASSGSDDDLPF